MRADLHVHSTASDGTLHPVELVSLASCQRVDVLAVADHDSVDGVADAVEAGRLHGVTVVPAVELSAAVGERSVHILGYYIDITDSDLLCELGALREARMDRARSIVDALRADGYPVSIDDVLGLSLGGAVGRTHVARALVDAGHAATVSDAFERLVGRGKPFYRPKELRTPAEVIRLISDAGGLAVLAHPGVSATGDLIDGLVPLGLAGIEAYHADHTSAQKILFARDASDRRLLATGGTDFHSPDAPNPNLGDVDIPEAAIRAFLAAGASRGQ